MKFGYHIFTKKPYYNSLKDLKGFKEFEEELSIGFYSKDEGGTEGEFSLRFYKDNDKWRLESNVYTDGYNAFVEFMKALKHIDLNSEISPEIIINALIKHKAFDFT